MAGLSSGKLGTIMEKKFFSLDTKIGTARAMVYWDRLTADQKLAILLSSSREPDPELQDLILGDGDPLCIEIAFRSYRKPFSLYLNKNSKQAEKLCGHLNAVWKTRLGFSPWDIDELPKSYWPDFYMWFFGSPHFEGSYEEFESWANGFFARKQFEQRVLIEFGLCSIFRSSIALLTFGVRQKKLSCDDAAVLFRSAVSASYDEDRNDHDSTWGEGVTWDDVRALVAFITAIALEDDGDTSGRPRLPLRNVIYDLPQLVLRDDSVEQFLDLPDHALRLMLKMEHRGRHRHDYTALRQRIAAASA
jgi:hypothetical protein